MPAHYSPPARLAARSSGFSGDYSPFIYTEHRIVDPTADDVRNNQDVNAEQPRDFVGEIQVSLPPVAKPPTTNQDLFALPRAAPAAAPEMSVIERASDVVVEPGDTVIVRFDDNRIRRFCLSADTHRPEAGVVHINQPIALALLGNGLEEEVEFVVDGKSRMVVIEKISKAAELELAS